ELSMLDTSIQQLLEKAIDSPIKLQICLVLYENRQLEGTPTQFANRLYRDIWSTREALRQLAEDGILSANSSHGGEPIYAYRPRPRVCRCILWIGTNLQRATRAR